MDGLRSDAFNRIKPFCVELLQNQTQSAVQDLYGALMRVNVDVLDDLSQYIMFPLRVTLKKRKDGSDDLLIEIARCLGHLFHHSTLTEWDIACEFLAVLSNAISNPSDKTFAAKGSEELKKNIVICFGNLFDHACYPVWAELYHPSNSPILGHIVTLLLSVLKSNVARDIRLAACRALKSLCKPGYHSLIEESGQGQLTVTTGDIMACFLPGISSCLSKIVTGDPSAGHKIKEACLDLLLTIVVVTLGDKNIELSRDLKRHKTVSDKLDDKLASLMVNRDEKWVVKVAEKLGPVIASASSASDSDNWSVRLSCVNFCSDILIQCSDTLKSCANILLKVPVKLLNDDFSQVASRCQEILESFSSRLQEEKTESRILVEILEENLFVLCKDLPRLMRRTSDIEKLSTLKIFLGYLTLLREKLNNLLYSQAHLKKLGTALLHCFELDTASVHFLDQVVALDTMAKQVEDTAALSSWTFRKHFCHFRDERVHDVLRSICHVLGQYGDLNILSDHFLEVYSTSETNCKQAVLILNGILSGTSARTKSGDRPSDGGCKSIIRNVLNEYISPENWYLVTASDSDYLPTHHQRRTAKCTNSQTLATMHSTGTLSHRETTIKAIKSNMLLCCLQLEAILTFSKVLREDFRMFLMDALYPLLEKASDVENTISSCAVHTLHCVAINCRYATSAELIADNADYLISNISVQLHHPDLFPRCPSVLQAMLDHSNSDMLALVSDTIDEILTGLDLQYLNPPKLLIFLPVLLSVVKAVDRWQGSNIQEEIQEHVFNFQKPRRSAKEFADELKNSLLEYQENERIASLNTEAEVDPDWEPKEEDVSPDMQEEAEIEKDKKEPPMEINVTSKVLTRCIHLMTHVDPRVRMKVMDVVTTGVRVISTQENELLPMAHKLWSPLVARFGDKELQVVMRAFDTLCFIAKHARDFLRRRFCKEILPKILDVLKSQATHSARISTGMYKTTLITMPHRENTSNTSAESKAYSQTTAFKLQRKALSGLGPLLSHVNVFKKDHASVCRSCTSYLSNRQPEALQVAAVTLFKYLMDIDPDATWIHLSGVWCPDRTLQPPELWKGHPHWCDLQTLHLGGCTDPNSEYASNVRKLLKYCS